MLMSPLSIAQYFPNQALFDGVIFDEASPVLTWDAVGAIARGRQTSSWATPNSCRQPISSVATTGCEGRSLVA
jgi:hypothetical protein